MTRAKWPNNDSKEAADWDFDKFRQWACVQLVEAFILEGSRGVKAELHGILWTHQEWVKRKEKAEKTS